MTSIYGKYILLTGGSRGIGPIIAEALAARGAHIALAARSEKDLLATANNLSKLGMFAKFNLNSPGLLGSTSPDKVAKAVVNAIENEKLEVFVNSSPARLLSVACEFSPPLGDWLKKAIGVIDFQRKKVEKRL